MKGKLLPGCRWALTVLLAVALPQLTAVRAEPGTTAAPPTTDEICRTLAQAAADNELPEEFFARLIWQESRFDAAAVSPAGAQGIAQFMPQTAAMRGLTNAFEPLEALRESASYLRELRTTFRGNLGLAAAAYNAGPGQVGAWLAGRLPLPGETQAYVRIVTGYSAQEWAAPSPPTVPVLPSDAAQSGAKTGAQIGARCVELAKLMIEGPSRRPVLTADPAWGPWGVQLAGTWSEGRVLATYERLRRRYDSILGDRLPLVLSARRRAPANFLVRVSEKSRTEAEALCAKLKAVGAACIVLRNPRS
ncbi:lytic transglycosylase domain-containing protein [soil metagenome]